jgi:hypothetical protein
MGVPAYAIDDQTAIKVTDGTVEIVSGALEAVHPQPVSKRIRLRRHAGSAGPVFGNIP